MPKNESAERGDGVTARSAKVRREPGALKGQIQMADDFDELPAEIAEAFGTEGSSAEDVCCRF
jgi:hypothetical protein